MCRHPFLRQDASVTSALLLVSLREHNKGCVGEYTLASYQEIMVFNAMTTVSSMEGNLWKTRFGKHWIVPVSSKLWNVRMQECFFNQNVCRETASFYVLANPINSKYNL